MCDDYCKYFVVRWIFYFLFVICSSDWYKQDTYVSSASLIYPCLKCDLFLYYLKTIWFKTSYVFVSKLHFCHLFRLLTIWWQTPAPSTTNCPPSSSQHFSVSTHISIDCYWVKSSASRNVITNQVEAENLGGYDNYNKSSAGSFVQFHV